MASRTSITYNGVSLQNTVYVTEEIQHESMDSKILDLQKLATEDGGKVVSTEWNPKKISLRGTIFGTSQADLEDNIDELKRILNEDNKDLDVEYAGGTRRYKVYTAELTLVRRHYNLTFADYEAEFVVAKEPFGQSIDTSTAVFERWGLSPISTVGTSTIDGVLCFKGNRRPLPIIQITVNTQTDLAKISVRNVDTGSSIYVERDYSNGEVLEIDTQNFTVTVDDVAVDYDGFFPEFIQSCNEIKVGITADAANITVKFIYYELYL